VQGKISEVSKSHAAALSIDFTVSGIPANHLRNFDVEQMGRVQCLQRLEQPSFYRRGGRRAKKRFEHGPMHLRQSSAIAFGANGLCRPH